MKTIACKFLPCTNTKPDRIRASCEGDYITSSVGFKRSIDEAYVEIAQELKTKLKLEGEMVGGHANNGMVFVFINDKARLA